MMPSTPAKSKSIIERIIDSLSLSLDRWMNIPWEKRNLLPKSAYVLAMIVCYILALGIFIGIILVINPGWVKSGIDFLKMNLPIYWPWLIVLPVYYDHSFRFIGFFVVGGFLGRELLPFTFKDEISPVQGFLIGAAFFIIASALSIFAAKRRHPLDLGPNKA